MVQPTDRNRLKLGPGKHHVGADGLFLLVAKDGCSRRWVCRLTGLDGRIHDYGLGSARLRTVQEARTAAFELHRRLRSGEPAREAKRSSLTFLAAAQTVWEQHRPGWRNEKAAAQWLATLEQHAFPLLGCMDVASIDPAVVLRVLSPIWLTLPETARRIRQRIAVVMDWCIVAGHRPANLGNPCSGIQAALPRQPRAEHHHPSMPWQQVPALMIALAVGSSTASCGQPAGAATLHALMWTILTVARTAETLGATWGEVNPNSNTWTVPAERMKAGREHVVPLSRQAMGLLSSSKALASQDIAAGDAGSLTSYAKQPLFPGRGGKNLSQMSLLMALRRLESGCTVHGFRASFRDWVEETEAAPSSIAEASLSHCNGSKTARAYQRSDLLERRRRLMQAWADCVMPG